jgi:hypothetical protein
MKVLKIAALSAAVLAAGGCATEMAWTRYDGRPLDGSFGWTAAHCRERAKERGDYRDERAEIMERCMKRHGYVWSTVVVEAPRGRHHHHDYDYDYDDD